MLNNIEGKLFMLSVFIFLFEIQSIECNLSLDSKGAKFRHVLQTIQERSFNKIIPSCFPGFQYYAGSCYFLSVAPSNWLSARNNCPNIKNSSLITLKNMSELNFVTETFLKTSNINEVFIGLEKQKANKWYWLDGSSFDDSEVASLFNTDRDQVSHCGMIYRMGTKITIEPRSCSDHSVRYVCKYVLDHCYGKNVCRNGGKCISLLTKHECRCSFLHQGPACERFSPKAIQSIIALVIIVFMILAGCLMKFNICSNCHWRNECRSTDDLFHDRQIILDAHTRKRSMNNY